MSKQYYICDIIGDGIEPETAFRPAIADEGVNWVGSIPTDSNGQPLFDWVLVLVATQNHARLTPLSGIDPLPDFFLDGKVDAIQTAALTALGNVFQRRGIDISLAGSKGCSEVLDEVGKKQSASFNVRKMNIDDI